MAKRRGKKFHKKPRNFQKFTNNTSTEVVTHPPVPHIDSAEEQAIAPVVNSNETATKKTEELAGYIFMCSGRTKPDCYVNRVFGLPVGKKEVVQKIKPGAKLFLYDYDVKFLYGVYEAVSAGGMNLQPTAFGGMFPAQVEFKICMDCLPLSLDSFKTAIKDNFQGSKFAQELHDQQVRDLLMLFKPITATSSATPPLPLPMPNVAPGLQAQPPAASRTRRRGKARNGKRKPSLNPHIKKQYQPYMARPSHNRSQQPNRPRFVQKNTQQPLVHNHYPSATHQVLSARVNPPYFSNVQHGILHEPYPRYTTAHELHHHDQTLGFNGGYIGLAPQTAMNHAGTSHGHNPNPTLIYGSNPHLYRDPTHLRLQPSMPVSSYYQLPGPHI